MPAAPKPPVYLGPDFDTGVRKEQQYKLAEVILKRVSRQSEGFTFGKFLRNIVSNKPFSGMDIAIESGDEIQAILGDLNAHYKNKKTSEGYDEDRDAHFSVYEVWNPRTKTKVDVKFWTGVNYWGDIDIDADVNALVRTSENRIKLNDIYTGELSKDDIIAKIKTGKFEKLIRSKQLDKELAAWAGKKSVTNGKEGTMIEEAKKMLKQDAIDAGYRMASHQMTKGVKAGLLALMKDKGMDGGKIEAIREVLETPIGDALIATLMGYGLTYVPQLQDDARAQKLAEEFRITGMATAGNLVLDSAFQYLLPVITETMNALPAVEEKVRVEASVPAEEFEEGEEEETDPKQATA